MVFVYFLYFLYGLVFYEIVLIFFYCCLMGRYRLMLDCWGEFINDRLFFNDIEVRLDIVF